MRPGPRVGSVWRRQVQLSHLARQTRSRKSFLSGSWRMAATRPTPAHTPLRAVAGTWQVQELGRCRKVAGGRCTGFAPPLSACDCTPRSSVGPPSQALGASPASRTHPSHQRQVKKPNTTPNHKPVRGTSVLKERRGETGWSAPSAMACPASSECHTVGSH